MIINQFFVGLGLVIGFVSKMDQDQLVWLCNCMLHWLSSLLLIECSVKNPGCETLTLDLIPGLATLFHWGADNRVYCVIPAKDYNKQAIWLISTLSASEEVVIREIAWCCWNVYSLRRSLSSCQLHHSEVFLFVQKPNKWHARCFCDCGLLSDFVLDMSFIIYCPLHCRSCKDKSLS